MSAVDYGVAEASAVDYGIAVTEALFTITSYPDKITAYQSYTININVSIKNEGSIEGTCEVRLRDHNNNIVASRQITLAVNEEKSVLIQTTAPSEAGSYTWLIEAYNIDTDTLDDSKSITIEVVSVYNLYMLQMINMMLLVLIVMIIVELISLVRAK